MTDTFNDAPRQSPAPSTPSTDWRTQELRQWALQHAVSTYISSGKDLLAEAQAIYEWVMK